MHEGADAWPCGADHLRQFLMRNPVFEAQAERVLLAKFAGQLQQGLAQSLFAVDRHQVGDDLLLLRDARGQILHEAFEQRVAAQQFQELSAGNQFQDRLFHGHGGFQARARAGEAQLAENISRGVDGEQALLAFGREHQQFDLPGLDEVDRFIPVSAGVDVGVFRNSDGAGIERVAPQRIPHLLFEPIRPRSLLNHERPFPCPSPPITFDHAHS